MWKFTLVTALVQAMPFSEFDKTGSLMQNNYAEDPRPNSFIPGFDPKL
jgi:hypothetical protein